MSLQLTGSPSTISNTGDQQTTTFFVDNIHCPSCVSHAQDIIRPISGIHKVDVSLLNHTIHVQHDQNAALKVTQTLQKAAFEVRHVTTSDSSGNIISSNDVLPSHSRSSLRHILPFSNKAESRHIKNCSACQQERSAQSWISGLRTSMVDRSHKRRRKQNYKSTSDIEQGHGNDSWAALEEIPPQPATEHASATEHVAEISVTGMTCASCTNSITSELQQIDFVQDVQVNLLENSARIVYHGSRMDAQRLADAIDNAGYEAVITKVSLKNTSEKPAVEYEATFSIEGMTCGSCVATITDGLRKIDGLSSVNVDLLSNSAKVGVKSQDKTNVILEAIDDLGFDATFVELQQKVSSQPSNTLTERTVKFSISGMYCSLCPRKISTKLGETYGKYLTISEAPTLDQATVVVKYEPHSRPNLNVRRIKFAIESVDPEITAHVYHTPTVEERSHDIARREMHKILRHLFFTFIAAIPTFIIGIVFASLVNSRNSTRLWFNQPMWSGRATRMDWAMFILTTPVMFYGASVFHVRALHEIWSIWRPKSKVPILRRFYRFGSMNLLISAGTSVAYFSSIAVLAMDAAMSSSTNGGEAGQSTTYFDTVTFLTLFILAGKFLQAYSKSKTGDAVALLGKLRPTEALLVDNAAQLSQEKIESKVISVPLDLLEVGDVVSVPRGSSPPVDGIVDQEGNFYFDESSLTGESKPVRKLQGDTILTGSVNVSDPVRIIVKELGGKSMLDQIISVVREGQSKRAPMERYADVLTSYFTPAITFIAILTWIIWLSLGESGTLPVAWLNNSQGGWAFWSVEFAIAVFVVACPCGLGLAAPTALFVGGGLAAKAGILVQGGGEAFQEASKLDAIVFDKTGTLTEGQMRVTELVKLDDSVHEETILALAKALEESSTHPVAKAVTKYCEDGLKDTDISVTNIDLKDVSGQGMHGTFSVKTPDGDQCQTYEAAIGNERLLSSLHHTSAPATNPFLTSTLHRLQSTGASTVIISVRLVPDGSSETTPPILLTPSTVMAITDPIRPEAHTVLNTLRNLGLAIHMCTGDNSTTALSIASQLDIPASHIRPNALPQDKANYIQQLQHPSASRSRSRNNDHHPKRNIIAFVGDGTNDTPALTTSDVSIALSSGSDIALTSASFVLLSNNLASVLALIRLSKRVFRRVKLNFAWAAVYNLALVPVAAGVFYPIGQWRLSPVWASAAMAGSSVSVVLSSLALKLPELGILRAGFERRRGV